MVTQGEVHAEDIQGLRQLLRDGSPLHLHPHPKFQTNDDEPHPVLSDNSNLIVITDESHRSQYDTLALNMRTALPNAGFIAFTGTPLIAGEERDAGGVSENMSRSTISSSRSRTAATVPLYYENRVPRMQLIAEHLTEDIEQILESAELDEHRRVGSRRSLPYNTMSSRGRNA